MDHIVVVKAAHHVDDGGALADVGQKFVAQALALGSALDQTGDVHEGGGGLLWVIHFTELVQAVVWHSHHAHVGINGAERVVGAFGAGVGNGVKQGALAHVGQTHNA